MRNTQIVSNARLLSGYCPATAAYRWRCSAESLVTCCRPRSLSCRPRLGLGLKKINSLINLLHRAAVEEDSEIGFSPGENGSKRGDRQRDRFDPLSTSEADWIQWRTTIRRHRLEREALGRLAPSLKSVPTVIWSTPLEFYLDKSLSEIRQLRTHGEKRVRAVLGVFHWVHALLASVPPRQDIVLRVVPTAVHNAESWLLATAHSGEIPGVRQIRRGLAAPLLEQIRTDAKPTVYDLAEARLGVNSAPRTVRAQARRIGVTRARIYQLLEECARIMEVRWPEGRWQLQRLEEHIAASSAESDASELVRVVRELFCPSKSERDERNGDC